MYAHTHAYTERERETQMELLVSNLSNGHSYFTKSIVCEDTCLETAYLIDPSLILSPGILV